MDWGRAWEEIVELVFPPRCALCDQLGEPAFCPRCLAQVEYLAPPYCVCCGRPLMPTADPHTLCGACRADRPRLEGARAVGLHTGVLRQAVLRLKFGRQRNLVRPLGELLAARWAQEPGSPHALPWSALDALLPVALHPRRRAWRGFDQAALLSRELARHTGLRCREGVLLRVKDTPAQVGLSAAQRRENVRGAFSVKGIAAVRGARLLLLDDVWTTGATLGEAARALHRAGAREVYGLTLTRALPLWHLGSVVGLGDEEDPEAS